MTSAGGKLFRSRHQKQHARGCAHPSTSSSYGSHVSPSFACSVRRTQGSIDCDNMQRDACSSKCQKCAHVNTIHPNVNEARPRFIHSFIPSIYGWIRGWGRPLTKGPSIPSHGSPSLMTQLQLPNTGDRPKSRCFSGHLHFILLLYGEPSFRYIGPAAHALPRRPAPSRHPCPSLHRLLPDPAAMAS